MAKAFLKRANNCDSSFYVDNTCIDCGTCYWVAPETFKKDGPQSAVFCDPSTMEQIDLAHVAKYCCPTNSIGHIGKHSCPPPFPRNLEDNVYHLGFHDRKSFGATSYLIKCSNGNILIDSPRFVRKLANRIHNDGGIKYQLLTHEDDVADSHLYKKEFNTTLYFPSGDKAPPRLDIDQTLDSDKSEIQITPELLAISVPGHTKGHFCFLYKEKFLFTGDHLCFSRHLRHLYAFINHCWHSKELLLDSVKKLRNYQFSYVLPGHGSPHNFDSSKSAKESLNRGIAWMESNM
jgi:glyoxylase-like metal-dependent hydrolase (beta-lactamase superfamily II)/ferredoxin